MANHRTKVMDAPVNPAMLPGLIIVAGSVTLDDTKTATITFPAKGVWTAIGTMGAAAVAVSKSVTSNLASVVFTAAANGTLEYIIIASVTETYTVPDAGTSDIAITPIT